MKKLVLLFVVASIAIPAQAAIFFDNMNAGGPPDPENRSPVNWDVWATNPSSAFQKLSTRAFGGDNAMVLSQWGTDAGITTKESYNVSGFSSLEITVEAKSEGWGWNLTGLVGGIFADASGNSLGTVLVSLTDIASGVYLKDAISWTSYAATLAVPTGAASAKFQIVNPYGSTGTNGALWFDNFEVTPEPMTMGLLGIGALCLRRRK